MAHTQTAAQLYLVLSHSVCPSCDAPAIGSWELRNKSQVEELLVVVVVHAALHVVEHR